MDRNVVNTRTCRNIRKENNEEIICAGREIADESISYLYVEWLAAQ